MKTIIIFEGIASSGKTTLEKMLIEKMPNAVIISEGDTLMPIIDNKDPEIALGHLWSQIAAIREENSKYVIVDRFHFTHAFRTGSNLGIFAEIETALQEIGRVLVVFLTIDPNHIRERIEETMMYRKDSWKKGVQGSLEEKVMYYSEQQEVLKNFSALSHLPIIAIDTTEKDWGACLESIMYRQ